MDADRTTYRKELKMQTKEKLRPGSMMLLPDIEYMGDEECRKKKVMREYRVIKHYEHCCLVQNEYGVRRAPSNAELMQMGIVTQQF